MVREFGAFLKPVSTPRLIRPALIFSKLLTLICSQCYRPCTYHIGCTRALFEVCLSPSRRQRIVDPVAGICTVHTKWIRVVAIDINWGIGTRCIESPRPGLIACHRDYYTKIAELLHEVVHIVGVGESHIVSACAVFVLGLEEDKGTTCRVLSVTLSHAVWRYIYTVGYLCLCNDRRDVFDIVLRGLLIVTIRSSYIAGNPL